MLGSAGAGSRGVSAADNNFGNRCRARDAGGLMETLVCPPLSNLAVKAEARCCYVEGEATVIGTLADRVDGKRCNSAWVPGSVVTAGR